jgi:hypothetical protein
MKEPLMVASCSQFDTRFAQVGKSGETRIVTSIPAFLSCGRRYSAINW